MHKTMRAASCLTVNEAKHMTAALLALTDDPEDRGEWHNEQFAKAKRAMIRIIGISLDPTKNGYELALAIDDFHNYRYFRSLGFSSFTNWCEQYDFSPSKIDRYLETFYELSESRAIDLVVYMHLSPGKIEKLIKPFLPDEPKRPKWDSDPETQSSWNRWICDLESCLKAAK